VAKYDPQRLKPMKEDFYGAAEAAPFQRSCALSKKLRPFKEVSLREFPRLVKWCPDATDRTSVTLKVVALAI